MFERVLTPRLHTASFPRGELVFGVFTFCSHFCSSGEKTPLPSRLGVEQTFSEGERTLTHLVELRRS